ncbi:gag/pol protein [Cucumis melo var. makuwa]|uniref:Gag/pol protein n=1 Tax=Cucumis melo var. makuwa TaxID=1194695 RepID=A0A5A7T0G5_CUCMM|nr:gag/pol protein [Cucumis melo var. makuwa]TYK21310.1 gag/pol protein [Cucumis melo var. makuwa]
MDLEMESMYFNLVWEIVDLPEGVKPIGCKWIYKRKRDSAGKVQTFKARFVAKGYTQREGVDYEETFSPVAMLKSIRILLSIATFYDYEIWKMDVKTAFLNDNLEESIFMSQHEGFITQGQEQKVCKLNRSIYGLKQASRSWNIRFDTAIKSYGFDQNVDEPCVYKKINKGKVAFLVLYVDDILLIGNDVGYLTDIKAWLAAQFQMKDLGETQYVLGIQIIRDHSKKDLLPFRHGVHLSKEQCPKTPQEVENMRRISYGSAVGSLMYAMLCTRPDICYAVGIVSRYQSNPGLDHWTVVKIILKYLRRTRDYMLVYGAKDLILTGYTHFQTDKDSRKSTSRSVFILNGGAVVWRSIKQGCIADSTMEAEYVAACEAAKEAVWLRKFLHDLEVVLNMNLPMTLYCDNSGAIANSKEPRSHKRGKHIERKYHMIREIVQRGDAIVTKIASEHNIADPFTKTLTTNVFEGHLESLGLRDMYIRDCPLICTSESGQIADSICLSFWDKTEWGAGNIITQDGIHSFPPLGSIRSPS